jgi:MFS family permease
MDAAISLPRRTVFDMNGYQWAVLLAAWLGWGFDLFDGLLFNYVAPNCVPTLLGLPLGSPEAKAATLQWTGILTSVLLVGWAVGGVLFGKVADRLGRTKTLLLTMLLYSFGTAACAAAPNIWILLLCRAASSLGIGGEWAAGAAMVAEVVPEKRRVAAGALLFTASPIGGFLATYVTFQITSVYFKDPSVSWRYVFLFGMLPAAVAFFIRLFIKEPDRWKKIGEHQAAKIRELFSPQYLRLTLSGLSMAVIALIVYWSCGAFAPVIAKGLAAQEAARIGLDAASAELMGQQWIKEATNNINIGGVVGALLVIPLAKLLSRRNTFFVYLAGIAISLIVAFAPGFEPHIRLYFYFLIGLTSIGIFAIFPFYIPELFPTRVRCTGSGFTYNIGRLIAAGGPFLVGSISASGTNALDSASRLMFWLAVIPIVGILLLPFVVETKGRELID